MRVSFSTTGLDARKQIFKETGKSLSYTATALLLPKLKQDLPWLKEADSQIYLRLSSDEEAPTELRRGAVLQYFTRK